jgi:hypothetical protein
MFGMLKEALQELFHSDDEVKEAVHFWLQQQAKTFSTGIQKLVERCEKCIAKDSDVEK